ncbi:hypothetical protein AYM40_30115 [Paraburkholderia phytofirmans OLGA172]|uniref:Uncharacterized protein n=1 Tax=Paraburkholderia phytofirmans OLGA172 TaxID=1417228 RepID=A0A160FTH3_9BURK|nr:hypothetical protein AYM40_30115 [Paraburkholderia phytofirmans OLGA172]
MGANNAHEPVSADCVEKVAAWLFQFSRKKIDLSDRPTNRSRAPVKGTKTPGNLAIETDSDFFNSIGKLPPFASSCCFAITHIVFDLDGQSSLLASVVR